MVDEINNSLNQLSQISNPSQAESAQRRLSDDFDDFLLLLTTQLENQDPTEPLEANEFTNQLVAFTGVEQQIATNEHLEDLLQFQQNEQFSTAVNYIGTLVDAKGRSGALINGEAAFAYELDNAADEVQVIISNSEGRAVFSAAGSKALGKNTIGWDGRNSFNGNQEPDGTYFITVNARDESGDDVGVTTYATGFVGGAKQDNGNILLDVGGVDVPLSDVSTVSAPPQFFNNGNNGV